MRNQIILLVILIVAAMGYFFFSNTNVLITDFDSCVAAGNPVMESYPRRCASDGRTFIENIDAPISGGVFKCESEQRNADGCIEIYQPVCGEVNVRCITTPCPSVQETFPNSCFACKNSLVDIYTEGECMKN
ncbi:hypothetical protein CL630_00565 [bacterium]|nr:hypothetical protein [bacterium]|tara:strand:- start:3554 stop:3949 length:396 start_codon:yes stop_codon:yes gene_type:complete